MSTQPYKEDGSIEVKYRWQNDKTKLNASNLNTMWDEIQSNTTKIDAEKKAREDADTNLENKLIGTDSDTVDSNTIKGVRKALAAEVTNRTAADNALRGTPNDTSDKITIYGVKQALQEEIGTRVQLSEDVDDYVKYITGTETIPTDAVYADNNTKLRTDLNAESSARQSTDATLNIRVTNLSTDLDGVKQALQGDIDAPFKLENITVEDQISTSTLKTNTIYSEENSGISIEANNISIDSPTLGVAGEIIASEMTLNGNQSTNDNAAVKYSTLKQYVAEQISSEEDRTYSSVSSYENLPTDAKKGDIGIVESIIGGTDKKSLTAYVADILDGELTWVALDGNYNASNVYFDSDFTFTKDVGTVVIPTSGSKTVEATGKNLKEFLSGLFAAEEYPTTPSTSASINSSNIGAKEVGTNIAVKYSFSTSAGEYEYGPANDVTWSDYKATFNGETKTDASGTFTSVQVTDTTSLSITGSVKQSAGAVPVTNLGNKHSDAQIKAKSWTGLSKGTLTGYRAWFCGYKNGGDAIEEATAINGEQIRALGNSANGSWLTSMNVSRMKQMFFAAPAGKGYKPSIKDKSTTAPQTVQGPITVYVTGANSYVAGGDEEINGGMAYDVWYVDNADAASGDATLVIGKA